MLPFLLFAASVDKSPRTKKPLLRNHLTVLQKHFLLWGLTILVCVRIVRIFRCYGSRLTKRSNFLFFKKQITDKCECLMVSHCDKNRQEGLMMI